jgi:ERCC4-related helicase
MKLYTPGTLVQARQRLWRVDGQEGKTLYLTAVDETTKTTKLFLPVESVEPGNLPNPEANIVGTVQAHDLMLRAFRLSMVHSTAPLLALHHSRAIPVLYQLVPLVMALEQKKVRMLIADDIGLGKTIEAGLIMRELMARGLARRVLVICPASLREQWREALDYFFHIDAKIFSRTHRRSLERDLPAGTNPLEFLDNFIISVDYAKMPEIKNQILEVPWDIVVIDEAHQVAKPHQSGPDQTIKKDRWDLGQALAFSSKIKHLLLLTATPHNGYTDSFASLIRLLDVEAVEGPDHAPNILRQTAKKHIVQRRRQDVDEWLKDSLLTDSNDRESPFPTRDQDEITVLPTQQELDVIEEVNHYGDLILENAKKGHAQIQTLAGWAVLHLHKRALSSPEALRRSLKNRRKALHQRLEGLTEPESGLTSEAARANVLDEDFGELFDEDEIVDRSEKITPGDPAALHAELKALAFLEELAAKVTPSVDSKLQQLLKNTLRPMIGQKHKVILFTRYRDTQDYIADQIENASYYQHVKVFKLHGGMNEKQRQAIFSDFSKAKDAVLVATDAISEGVNLQYYASQIIHYELPWNPNRLEQRNGRIDRFGQPEPVVVIRTMVMDDTLDAAILKLLIEKTRQIRADFGFAPPYFGDEKNILDFIQEHGMGIKLSPTQLSWIDPQTIKKPNAEDPFDPQTLDRIQADSFYGQTEIALETIEKQMARVQNTIGSQEEIEQFVYSSLNRLDCHTEDNQDGTFKIILQHPDLHMPKIGSTIPQATFNPKLGADQPEIDVLDLGHPIVRRLMDILKREAFTPDGENNQAQIAYGRTAVMYTKAVTEMTALYTLLIRFTTAGDPPQIVEDLISIAAPVYSNKAISPEQVPQLIHASPEPGAPPLADAREVLEDALNRETLDDLFMRHIERRRKTLEEERRSLRDELTDHHAWLAGDIEINSSSSDLLAVKILWPT